MLSLRPTAETDRDQIRDWRNQPDVARWMYTHHEISEAEHAAWFARHLVDPRARSWVIEWDGTGVGVVNLSDLDADARTAEWGIYVADALARGTGAAEGATFLSLQQAFGALHLDEVTCEAIAGNDRALRLYERMGFRRRHGQPVTVIRAGEPFDVVELVLRADEWAAVRPDHRHRLVSRSVLGEDVAHD